MNRIRYKRVLYVILDREKFGNGSNLAEVSAAPERTPYGSELGLLHDREIERASTE